MIIALLVIALALAGALFFVGRPKPPAAPPVPLISTSPRDITSLELTWAVDGSLMSRMHRLDDGMWVAHWKVGDVSGSWPAIPSRVAGALTLLSKVQGTPSDSVETLGDPVRIVLGDQSSSTTLSAAKRAFGGVGSVVRPAAGTQPALAADVDGQLIQVFQRQDVMAWRDLSVFPGDLSQTARIFLNPPERAGAALQAPLQPTDLPIAVRTRLQRVGSRWSLIEPANAPADRAQIEGFIGLLKKLRIAKFPTEQPGWVGGKDSDFTQSIVLETDRRNPDASGTAERWTIRHELELGPFAGEQSTLARASVSRIKDGKSEYLWGPTIIMIDGATGEELMRPAEAFSTRIAARAVTADIRGILVAIQGKSYTAKRLLEDWKDSKDQNVELIERDAIKGIITLLTETPASRVVLGSVDAPPPDAATVELNGAGGPPLDTIKLWQPQGSNELFAQSGQLTLIYTGEPVGGWNAWLATLAAAAK
jgi:hypothetical protein